MDRKEFFLKTAALAGIGLFSCKHSIDDPPTVPPPDTVLLKIDLNTELLAVGAIFQDLLRGIFVKRVATSNIPASFVCYNMACTHSGCIISLQPNKEFHCPCHGSKFDENGNVIIGPAARALDKFRVEVDGTNILIKR